MTSKETRDFALAEVRFSRAIDLSDASGTVATGSLVEGYAIVFNSDSEDLGGFREQVAPGALTRSLSDAAAGNTNIFALWSHDSAIPIGSTRSGSLTLAQDDKGLRFTLDPSRLTDQQLAAVVAGDMRMSFGFVVRSDTWEERADGTILRTLLDVDLSEVSPVAFPAYPDTSAAKRSMDEWRSAQTVEIENVEVSAMTSTRVELMKRFIDSRLRRI